MNAYLSQPAVVLSRPLIGGVVSGVGKVLRAAGMVLASWRDNRARSRAVRGVDATHLSEHILRDIGVHDRLISRVAAHSDADHRQWIWVRLSAAFWVIALMVTTTLAATGEATASPPTGKPGAKAQMVGVFTGEYFNGAPVYRLPPVAVVASRKEELAKLEREEQSARARQARAKAATKSPA